MGEVVRFVPKSELERARLIREARAIYESIFPDAEGPGSQNVDSLVAARHTRPRRSDRRVGRLKVANKDL
jgi:hypothetical protein